jgi:nondiscriminating aspartyl-tRNA synthetase
MRTLAKDIKQAADTEPEKVIEAEGWVHRIRDMGQICFVILRDRSGMAQLVFDKKPVDDKNEPLTLESVIRVTGTAALNPKAPGGAEIRVSSFEILSRAAPDLPYQVNGDPAKFSLETILDNRFLSLRNPKIRAIFKVQNVIVRSFGDYLREQDFTEIKTSKLVNSGTEGGTELFKVEYFDRKLCLAQSPQLYKEALVAAGFERVFEVAPVYRAEKHDTPRHLNEYVSMDVEMGFIDNDIELIELEKGLLAHILAAVTTECAPELALWGQNFPAPEKIAAALAGAPIVSYEETLKIVNEEAEKESKGKHERIFDISPEAERLICAWAAREHGVPLAFINQFPRRQRPFYTYPLDTDEGEAVSTMSFDAIYRGLEITSGSRRHHDYETFVKTLPRFGIQPEDMPGYLSLLKYGCPPHGGFAIAKLLTKN